MMESTDWNPDDEVFRRVLIPSIVESLKANNLNRTDIDFFFDNQPLKSYLQLQARKRDLGGEHSDFHLYIVNTFYDLEIDPPNMNEFQLNLRHQSVLKGKENEIQKRLELDPGNTVLQNAYIALVKERAQNWYEGKVRLVPGENFNQQIELFSAYKEHMTRLKQELSQHPENLGLGAMQNALAQEICRATIPTEVPAYGQNWRQSRIDEDKIIECLTYQQEVLRALMARKPDNLQDLQQVDTQLRDRGDRFLTESANRCILKAHELIKADQKDEALSLLKDGSYLFGGQYDFLVEDKVGEQLSNLRIALDTDIRLSQDPSKVDLNELSMYLAACIDLTNERTEIGLLLQPDLNLLFGDLTSRLQSFVQTREVEDGQIGICLTLLMKIKTASDQRLEDARKLVQGLRRGRP